ncbi:sensor histidine kinase [Paenibacillus sp. 1011MAR3C5]|uniref:sensor histidine kinase n=1 Tax=Paenibacillus sp. 1011MAR3C5 TaxID=1675787 RepID=UPI000E6BA7FB|nr:HAMP domain-containing sensor histidine kinase [Paenibacillus sp. 1011MAR3C5]RJE88772.1 sensor histidine kinase [Paenibacillus sp. 1011MAR3C5]
MVITFMILWILTILMIVFDWKTVSTRWAALITFCGGFGGFGRAWTETFMPSLRKYQMSADFLESMTIPLYNIGSFTNTNGLPYAFLMFALYYSNYASKKALRRLSIAAALPMIIMFWITPFQPIVDHNYHLLLVWVGPYVILGSVLLIHAYSKESSPILKRNKLAIMLLALPPVIFQLISNYILRLFHYEDAWRFNIISISVLFLIFSIFIYKWGLFGFKVHIEKVRMNSNLRTLTSGIVLLQHTLKNELGKINILSDQIAQVSSKQNLHEIEQNIKYIQSTSKHVLHMMDRLHHHAQGIVLFEKETPLIELITNSVVSMQSNLKNKSIQIHVSVPDDLIIICDPVLMQETFQNIISNSIEASHANTSIHIKAKMIGEEICMEFKDNGTGITKENMLYVYDPFFTTKGLKSNYGLGLTYCYKVIEAHGGVLQITSEKGNGTSVRINWPKFKSIIHIHHETRDIYA